MYFQLMHYAKEWVTPEKIDTHTQRKLRPSRDGGVKCVKNVLNVHWMSREGGGGGGIFIFLHWGGGGGSFAQLARPLFDLLQPNEPKAKKSPQVSSKQHVTWCEEHKIALPKLLDPLDNSPSSRCRRNILH